MKRVLVLALFVCGCACGMYAQAVDTNVCDVMKNPKSFDGKIVRIKGTVVAGFDQFMVRDTACGYQVNGIWLDYPQGTKGKAGPVALVQVQPAHNYSGAFTAPARTPVTLDKSKDFKQFDSLLSQPHNKGAGMCLGCARYEVSATLVGRLDGVAVADTTLKRDAAGKIVGFGGFGNMNAYPARLVLESVSDVTPKEVDFSKADAVTKGETATFSGNADLYDPIVAAQKSATALASSPAGAQAAKDIAVYGKAGEHNGVSIIYGPTNEAAAKDEALGVKDSPDGILYNCTLNLNRLEGDAELRAIMHMGQHIADLRSPVPGNEDAPLFILEYNAWTMTAAAAVANGQKFLTLPGGYLLWSTTWPAADRTTMMDDTLKKFLGDEELLSR
jgi:hypothetical protein